jgi:hypothetical protein
VIRVGADLWLDLGGEHVVHLDEEGFRLVPELECPVAFQLSSRAEQLPAPVKGGQIDELLEFLRISEDDFKLLVCWMVCTLVADRPCPILFFSGPKGASKSFSSRLVLSLVDPRQGGATLLPRGVQNLGSIANSYHVLALENVSEIADTIADALCAFCTGTQVGSRRLYTEHEGANMAVRIPIVINGICVPSQRADLLERILEIPLSPMPSSERRPENELLRRFEEARPRILGALLELVCGVLRHLPDVNVQDLGRMADFEVLSCAVCRVLGWDETLVRDALRDRRNDQHALAVSDNPAAYTLMRYLDRYGEFTGTPAELTERLRVFSQQAGLRSHQLPRQAHHVTRQINECSTDLASLGYHVERSFTRDHNKLRVIRVYRQSVGTRRASQDAAGSLNTPELELDVASYQVLSTASWNTSVQPDEELAWQAS